jgi:glycosyltransferase involved in cell wall biosynthesis
VRTALVHDWLTGMRGGEKVLEMLCELYPTADLYTLIHRPGSTSPVIERMQPRTSWLQHLPGITHYYRVCLPLFPFVIEQFDLGNYDLVISSSHCVAKSVIRAPHARHVCYCHTPMRYAWDQFDAYLGPQRVGWVASQLARPVMTAMARWDQRTAGRVDRYVANSQHVARRIRRYYNREAVVVYPPVDTAFYHPDGTVPEAWMLIVTALVPYKRVELAIEACRRANVPLRIVGDGPERGRLERMAGPEVEFLGVQRGERLRTLYRAAAAVLQPGEEDFGIVPVEAQACGRPVVALGRGGALETVQDGVTGVLVPEPTVEAFADGLKRAQALSFDPATIRAHALRFEPSRFAREFQTHVADVFDHAQTV